MRRCWGSSGNESASRFNEYAASRHKTLFADWNVLERLPHALLEGRAADVEREIKAGARSLNKADDMRDESLVIAIGPDEMRVWKAILKIAN